MDNLIKISEQISDKYLQSQTDMNASIAKYASDNNLSIDQTKRLVEESNKSCYLKKFASTGEQIFDIADFEKVKSLVKEFNTPEKTAGVVLLEKLDYNSFGEDLQKTASENTPGVPEYSEAISKCKSQCSILKNELTGLLKQASIYVAFENTSDFIKTASTDISVPEHLKNKIQNTLNQLEKYASIIEHLVEKHAGLLSAAGGAVLKGGGHAVGFVAKSPMKRGLQPLMIAETAKSGAKKYAPKVDEFVSNVADVNKTAGWLSEAGGTIVNEMKNPKGMAPWLLFAGALGITTAAAKGMGGIASNMMNQKQLDESFNTILETNEDLKTITGARAYFDVIARHAPDLAKDPMVAPQLIRQFETFGGVDVNTVGKLREIQNRFGPQGNKNTSGFDVIQTATNLHKLMGKTHDDNKPLSFPGKLKF